MKTVISLLTVSLFVLSAPGQGIKISQEPRTSSIAQQDLVLIDVLNPDGSYTTKAIMFANFGGSPQAVLIVTNLTVSTLMSLTNLFDNLTVTNAFTNLTATASTDPYWNAFKVLTFTPNGSGAKTNDGAGNIGWSTVPYLNGQNITNGLYQYETNNSGATTLSWQLAYRTNLAANVTLALATPNAAVYESLVYWVTNSSATDRSVTAPAGVIGPYGSGTPAVLWCTNKTLTRILFEHYGPNDIVVSKTDFNN